MAAGAWQTSERGRRTAPQRNAADAAERGIREVPAAKEIDMSDILYVVMPAYNEEENIESVVKGVYSA